MFNSKAKALSDALGDVPQMKMKWLLQHSVRWHRWVVGVEFEMISRLAIHKSETPCIYGVLVMFGPLQVTLSWDRVPVRNFTVAQEVAGMMQMPKIATRTRIPGPPVAVVQPGFGSGFDVAALQELRKRS